MGNDVVTIGIPIAIAVGSIIISLYSARNKVTTDAVDVLQTALTEQGKQLEKLQKQMADMQVKYDGMASLVKAALVEYFGEHSDVAKALLAKI